MRRARSPAGAIGAWVVLVGLLLPGAASAQVVTAPPAGTFQMLPALQGQHPRLYFTAADIPDLRAQALGPRKWYLDRAKAAFDGYTGTAAAYDGSWKDYLYGLWAQFSMCMFYLAEQDPAHAATARDWALFFARRSDWVQDDLVPMEITTGIALTYDILYDQFTEAERGELRAALKTAADFIYDRFFVDQYWTNDFQNNHMHNRINGLAHAAFALHGDDAGIDVQKHADLALWAIQQVADWLPPDGSTHEGPGYWSYGHHWVVHAMYLAEHVTGADPTTANPHFANDHYYRAYLTAPGWQRTFGIGDSGDGVPDNFDSATRAIAKLQDPHGAAVLRELMANVPDAFYQHTAWGLLWYDGTMAARPYAELPLWRFWPDLEMLSVRSSWDADATALVFKCGPPGGHRMQQRRAGQGWFNVAHDHPDQNHFLLFAHATLLAEDDGYPTDQKLTRSHNTLLVDGAGQTGDGGGWYQPFDYALTGTMDDVFLSQSTAFSTGNASRLYAGASRVVRHMLFVEGGYLVLLDDLAGDDGADHDFEWRLHKAGTWSQGAAGEFFVADGDVRLQVRFLAPDATALQSQFLATELTAPPSLAVTTRAPATRFLSVLVPQKGGLPAITAESLAVTGGAAVRAVDGSTIDVAGIAAGPGPLAFADVEMDGVAALVRQSAGLTLALLVRGTSLSQAGATLLAADAPANLAWRPTATGGRLEAEAPYKANGVDTTITVGALLPGHAYLASLDGAPGPTLGSDGSGLVVLPPLDLAARRVVELTDNGPIEDGGVPPWDGGWPDTDGGGAGDGGATGDGGVVADGGGAEAAGLSGSCGCGAGRGPAGALALFALVLLRRRSGGARRPRG
jgi:hypothetical protein